MTTAAELETWVREELSLDEAQTVEIREMPGTDPRCSPIVTVVAIGGAAGTVAAGGAGGTVATGGAADTVAVGAPAGAEAYSFHIERPLDELVRMDLVAALAFGGGH